MQNILTVQQRDLMPHLRLAHYQGLDLSAPSAADPTVEGITALRRRVHASQRLNLALQREKARNDALLASLRGVLGVTRDGVKHEDEADPSPSSGADNAGGQGTAGPSTFGFLHNKPALSSIGSSTPITTTTEFTVSQLTALRALSASLRNLLPNLAEASSGADADAAEGRGSGGGGGAAKKSWRRERAEYVEQSSRKCLENNGGLELGAQGEVRDGEYQGEGRNLSRGEVEGLEKVAAIMGERSNTEEGGGGGAQGEAMDES